MNTMAESVEAYLELRRGLGFKLGRPGQLLAQFARYCDDVGAEIVTNDLALTWARQPAGARSGWWSARLSVVRSFARYLHGLDARHEVPPRELLPRGPHRAEPFIYSLAELEALLQAASRLRQQRAAPTVTTYIGLLAVTGMRAGEAIRLNCEDLDMDNGLLVVRNSKFGKSRELMLHTSTVLALRDYEEHRRRLTESRTGAFFVSPLGARLDYNNVQRVFHRLAKVAGLQPRSDTCRPRLHDLRHTFAVNTILDWYRAGYDVAQRMHLLTTYLGHRHPSHTYWYLSATPELLEVVGQRLSAQLGDLA
jgi:integrase